MSNKSNSILRFNRLDWLILIVVAIPIIMSVIVYTELPDLMAVHFDTNNNPDSYWQKGTFLLLYSLFLIALPFLMKIGRKIDPKSKNYDKFGPAFEIFRFAITLLMSGLLAFTLLYNLGYGVNIQIVTLTGIGLLFIVVGNYLTQIRPAFFIGIRTPWTLSNEEVWRKTHRVAGPLWMISGIVFIISAFIDGQIAFGLIIFFISISVVLPMLFSYVLYKKITR